MLRARTRCSQTRSARTATVAKAQARPDDTDDKPGVYFRREKKLRVSARDNTTGKARTSFSRGFASTGRRKNYSQKLWSSGDIFVLSLRFIFWTDKDLAHQVGYRGMLVLLYLIACSDRPVPSQSIWSCNIVSMPPFQSPGYHLARVLTTVMPALICVVIKAFRP